MVMEVTTLELPSPAFLQALTTLNNQNHHFCRLPIMSLWGSIIRTYTNDGFGGQLYGIPYRPNKLLRPVVGARSSREPKAQPRHFVQDASFGNRRYPHDVAGDLLGVPTVRNPLAWPPELGRDSIRQGPEADKSPKTYIIWSSGLKSLKTR